jgi:hypothetical protein
MGLRVVDLAACGQICRSPLARRVLGVLQAQLQISFETEVVSCVTEDLVARAKSGSRR